MLDKEQIENWTRQGRKCSLCVHHTRGKYGAIYCAWEKTLPPPVFRARLWGEEPPPVHSEADAAAKCAQYQEAPRGSAEGC